MVGRQRRGTLWCCRASSSLLSTTPCLWSTSAITSWTNWNDYKTPVSASLLGALGQLQSMFPNMWQWHKNGDNDTKEKAAVELYNHTPITYSLSTSLASCNLKNGFRHFVPHITSNNNQFRECSSSFTSILPLILLCTIDLGWANSGPRTMWSATAFSVARGSIQEILQIWNILQFVTVNVSGETNLN